MTAQNDKQPEGGQGRSKDIQARQTDDGSFELVVDDAASGASGPQDAPVSSRPEPRPKKGGAGGRRRWGLVVAVALAALGVVVYAVSDDQEGDASKDAARVEAGFRPYVEGPGAGRAQAAPAVERPDEDELDLDEPEFVDEVGEVEEGFELDEDEVVVVDEELPPEEFEEAEVEDEFDAREKARFDASKIPRLRERIQLPVQTPEIKHLPKLNRLQPSLPQMRDTANEGLPNEDEDFQDEDLREEYLDEEAFNEEEEDYGDEGEEYDRFADEEEVDPEYEEEDDSFEDYEEGY